MNNQYPPRKRRADSFLGIHFDFHANDDCHDIGARTDREMVETIIKAVNPDYIQCDCKGHRGLSSYPTRVGYPAPGIVGDPLKIWREVTAEYGVALYMHYSGVWDTEALKHHPEWARIKEDGTADPDKTSVFGPYADELLIPQLKELAGVYGVDGAWIDGESWATIQDYGEAVLARFTCETGITEIPRSPTDPFFFEFTEFCREGFRAYLRHYLAEVKRVCPDFQIASNWAYSTFMPEPATIDVDFISGDYSLQNSVNSARLEGRYMARQGKSWDLMAWSFSSKGIEKCRSTKTVRQLQQEAAVVLALGGGFQAYFKQKRDGSIYQWQMDLMREVAAFCRDRQDVCHRSMAVPQIALLLSGPAFYRKSKRIFSPFDGELTALAGILRSLLENQYSLEVLGEHHLTGRLAEYPLVVVPEWTYLERDFKEELTDYVRQGGNLLLIGPATAALFAAELDIHISDETGPSEVWLEQDSWLGGHMAPSVRVTLGDEAVSLAYMHLEEDFIQQPLIAASWRQYGQGKIAGIYTLFGERYCNGKTAVHSGFIRSIVQALFPEPMVTLAGSTHVDVQISSKDGRLLINLVNTSGPHDNKDVYTNDDIPPVGPLELTVRTTSSVREILLHPGKISLPFAVEEGLIRLFLPSLDIHSVIELITDDRQPCLD